MSVLASVREGLAGSASEEPAERHGIEAFRRLTAAIVHLRYPPGAILTERQIMGDLEVTRGALREAVIHVADLGLMETLVRKGLQVTPIDALDVPRIYDARIAIETQLARFAAIRASVAALTELKERLREEIPPADSSPAERTRMFVEHDHGVHLAVAAAAGNRLLEDALTRILVSNQRLWYWIYAQVGPKNLLMFTHNEIFDAIEAGDPDAAERATQAHLRQARQALTDVFMHQLSGGQR